MACYLRSFNIKRENEAKCEYIFSLNSVKRLQAVCDWRGRTYLVFIGFL